MIEPEGDRVQLKQRPIVRGEPVRALRRRLGRGTAPVAGVARPDASARDWIKALRLHHWIKNGLIFVPIFLGGRVFFWPAWVSCLAAFAGMGCLASATYIFNDLMDLQEDRMHAQKRHRAFASGKIPIRAALWLIPLGVAAGFGFAMIAKGAECVMLFGIYLAISVSYSMGLKRLLFLDVALISGLFTLRLAIGVVCANVAWSPWLLVFSLLIFGSLSLAKRSTEILQVTARGGERLPGRGYLTADGGVVTRLGISCASAAILVMVLYLVDAAFQAKFYRAPELLWAFPFILAAWLGRMWLLCGRGKMPDDPVIFALRDKTSLALGAGLGLSLAAALFL